VLVSQLSRLKDKQLSGYDIEPLKDGIGRIFSHDGVRLVRGALYWRYSMYATIHRTRIIKTAGRPTVLT